MQSNAVPVFTHIPKTAGTTLHRIIRLQYLFRPGKVYSVADIPYLDRFKYLSVHEKERINSIKGHLHFGVHEHCPFPVRYFTMVRRPQSRAISHYNYFLKVYKFHPLYKKLDLRQYTLADFLERGILDELDNCHVRYLCGVSNIPYGGVSDEHLQMAIRNLKEHYDTIGITERFDESILLFAKAFNWNTPFYISGKVSGIKTSKVGSDRRTQELLAHYNRYDELLYQTALVMFEKQVQMAGSGFSDEVATFAEMNHKNEFLTLLKIHLASKLRYFDKNYLWNMQRLIKEHLGTL